MKMPPRDMLTWMSLQQSRRLYFLTRGLQVCLASSSQFEKSLRWLQCPLATFSLYSFLSEFFQRRVLSRIKTRFGTLILGARKITNERFRPVPGHTSRPYPDLADVEAGDEAIGWVHPFPHIPHAT